jgi:hypothetical protein
MPGLYLWLNYGTDAHAGAGIPWRLILHLPWVFCLYLTSSFVTENIF